MLPLCAALGITVNDLLSGERVGEGDYQKKAEENMMELMRKTRRTDSAFCSPSPAAA